MMMCGEPVIYQIDTGKKKTWHLFKPIQQSREQVVDSVPYHCPD